jgi:hypothetical protein
MYIIIEQLYNIGTIPSELSALTGLATLYLARNQLTGKHFYRVVVFCISYYHSTFKYPFKKIFFEII